MPSIRPVLELEDLRPSVAPGEIASAKFNLRLMPGEVALVNARDQRRAAWLADLSSGLIPVAAGKVRFLGRDWAAIPDHYAAALRGRIGRIFARGGWIEYLDVASNVLLPQLHHTKEDEVVLRQKATELACMFGLPGLPLAAIGELSQLDLARCACVRAFLGNPGLLLLESPVQGLFAELRAPLLNALATARGEGAAAIWFTGSEMVWADRSIPANHRLHLFDRGLVSARRAA
jgi:phospholipid/cholesterol/gamma-HCH transport system ATP-binding protein